MPQTYSDSYQPTTVASCPLVIPSSVASLFHIMTGRPIHRRNCPGILSLIQSGASHKFIFCRSVNDFLGGATSFFFSVLHSRCIHGWPKNWLDANTQLVDMCLIVASNVIFSNTLNCLFILPHTTSHSFFSPSTPFELRTHFSTPSTSVPGNISILGRYGLLWPVWTTAATLWNGFWCYVLGNIWIGFFSNIRWV
jgi:hypothetical protein